MRQKVSKVAEDLNNIINQPGLSDIYRIVHTTISRIIFPYLILGSSISSALQLTKVKSVLWWWLSNSYGDLIGTFPFISNMR